MESKTDQNKLTDDGYNTQLTSDCHPMPSENFKISDTFRVSLDNSPIIGENVMIGEKNVSLANSNIVTTVLSQACTSLSVPDSDGLETTNLKSPPILGTPKHTEEAQAKNRPQTLFKLSLTKNKDDVFVKPSPVAEIMSPAKMLQFEIDLTNSSTPTMKRAAIDFNFFNENNFEEYFTDVPKNVVSASADADSGAFIETPVIVKADTVRHEIGYGKLLIF